MLAPSGGGLILYQAYGNLYAMTGELETDAATLLKRIRKFSMAQDIGARSGQTMNGKTYRCVLCYRLGVSLFSVSKPCLACSRVFTGDIYGDHVPLRKLILVWMRRMTTLRPPDMLLYSWDIGLDVCVNLTESSPLVQTGTKNIVPGRAVIDMAHCKRVKYATKYEAIDMVLPF
nr:auxilin-like protein [Tanacetum cinerariifolium]